jgi:hypothetical protein
MSQPSGGTARPPAAWNEPAWVFALMMHPDSPDTLEYVRVKGRAAEFALPLDSLWQQYRKTCHGEMLTGLTAGTVLASLYALEMAGWRLPRGRVPSLRLAYHLAAEHG